METWDLVKIYCLALREKHYIEAISVGYQLLEFLLVTLMTKTNVGKNGVPLNYDLFSNKEKRYLYDKARLANNKGFIDEALRDEIQEFNQKRADIIHNLVEKNITEEQIVECAEMISPTYQKIQSLFLKISIGEEETNPHILPR